MFYAQHVVCYDSGSVERPSLSDDSCLIRCKMQIESSRKAMEYITNFMISTCRKNSCWETGVFHVVVTNVFPNGNFFHTQTNK